MSITIGDVTLSEAELQDGFSAESIFATPGSRGECWLGWKSTGTPAQKKKTKRFVCCQYFVTVVVGHCNRHGYFSAISYQ